MIMAFILHYKSAIPMGFIMNTVSSVLNIKGESILDSLLFETRLGTEYILSMNKISGDFEIYPNTIWHLNSEEICIIEKAA
jgi:purine-binding chemotaxis protein CheW